MRRSFPFLFCSSAYFYIMIPIILLLLSQIFHAGFIQRLEFIQRLKEWKLFGSFIQQLPVQFFVIDQWQWFPFLPRECHVFLLVSNPYKVVSNYFQSQLLLHPCVVQHHCSTAFDDQTSGMGAQMQALYCSDVMKAAHGTLHTPVTASDSLSYEIFCFLPDLF